MTPAEFFAHISGAREAQAEASRLTGWWAEYFARQKRLKPYSAYIEEAERNISARRVQTPSEMMANLARIAGVKRNPKFEGKG